MILADANIWVRHLRKADARLAGYLRDNRVVTSDVVLGELLLGAGLPPQLSSDLAALPKIPTPSAVETRGFIERHGKVLRDTGAGWADVQLIASAVAAGALVYSADKPVRAVWRALGFRQA